MYCALPGDCRTSFAMTFGCGCPALTVMLSAVETPGVAQKPRTTVRHQAEKLAKLRQEFLSVPRLIAKDCLRGSRAIRLAWY